MADPRQMWEQLQKHVQRVQKSGGARFGGAGGAGGPANPKAALSGIGLLIAGTGAFYLFNNALFNVDGGHRAIKYTRIGG
ncbi:Prohibitin-2, subunit of the prohibitin complex (Phb1p-Phb2p), partial [Oleoguttula sp. CCFEE 5521]